MTATDELRRLLDERGAGWWEEDGHTLWYGESTHHAASAFSSFLFGENERVHLNAMVTPAQAVEATLGRPTCRLDVLNTGDCAGYECSEYIMHCNACGHEFGHVLYNEDGDVWMSEPPNFCPNCGRKVVEK